MSICTNFEGALMKAIRSLEQNVDSLLSYDYSAYTQKELKAELEKVDDKRLWVIAQALRSGISYDEIYDITKIDRWFIHKIDKIVGLEKRLKAEALTKELLAEAKRMEFTDKVIAKLTPDGTVRSEAEIKKLRYQHNIEAAYKMVDRKRHV